MLLSYPANLILKVSYFTVYLPFITHTVHIYNRCLFCKQF